MKTYFPMKRDGKWKDWKLRTMVLAALSRNLLSLELGEIRRQQLSVPCVDVQAVRSPGATDTAGDNIPNVTSPFVNPWPGKNVLEVIQVLFSFWLIGTNVEVTQSQLISNQSLLIEKSNSALKFHWLEKMMSRTIWLKFEFCFFAVSKLNNC